MGIFVHDRTEEAKKVQSLLTAHSDNVRTRLGLKCRDGYKCGLILIELEGDLAGRKALQQELEKLDGVETKKVCLFDIFSLQQSVRRAWGLGHQGIPRNV
ncbi:hypothetical protein M427DRAFT_53346 [Gonapodya prolifera JEL478]|uniref:Uncharacterized protein n=1 Tax=Gonapodya prolifera (strain JEL478) TaxID=1344416 RepID=A0A139AQ22_GONPJ|nr:hypothetical protein M427DRAFT_53346 [Gonapodya prolifera JEL478]|eukprot:KXS18861.1 hypothetical protein M427DRAFT_53346 [Gonapodya prolifera JEL478]